MLRLYRGKVLLAVVLAFLTLASPGRAEKITGTTSDEAGKPIAGAKVYLTRQQSPADFRYAPAGEATTDAAGRFSAEIEPSQPPGKNSAGKPFPTFYGWATVSAPGYAAAQRQLKPGENAFTLKKAAVIRGKVTDAAGKPVAGAVAAVRYIFILGANGFPVQDRETLQTGLDEKVAALFEAKTGPDGAFALDNLPQGAQGALELKNPEYAFVQKPFKTGDASVLALQARPTAILIGKVVDEQGKPKVGVGVNAFGNESFTHATTGADGSYRISHLASGDHSVYLSDPKKECVALAQMGVAATEGKTTALPNFVVMEGAVVEASFVDDDTGKPISGMIVAAYGPHLPTNRIEDFSAAADESGVSRIRVYPGENTLRVGSSTEEYPKAYATPTQIVKAVRGQKSSVTFRLRKGVSVEGIVVGEDDKPLPGVHIRLLPEGWGYEFDREPGEPTDAAGKWKQTGIDREGRPLKLFLDAKYEVLSPLTVTLDPKDLTPKPLTIKVKRIETRSIAGRIVTADGKPLGGVSLSFAAYERTPDGDMKDFASKNTLSDAEGRYRLDTLRPNHSTVSARLSLQGYRYLSGGDQTKTAEGYDVSDIVLTPLTVNANGKVTDAKGKPIAGARVWCVEGLPGASAVTDATGAFALQGLPADGPASLTAMKGRSVARLVVKMRGGKADSGGLNALILTPEPIPAPSEGAIIARVAESLKQKAKEGNDWPLRQLLRSVARRDPDAALNVMEGMPVTREEDRDQNRFAALESFAHSGDPAKVTEWSAAQIEKFTTPQWRLCAESELAVVLAPTHPDLANRYYDEASALAANTDDPFNIGRLMAASGLLRRNDGDALAARLQAMNVDTWNKARVIGVIGRGDAARAEKMIEAMGAGADKQMQSYAYGNLLRSVLPNSPSNAQRLLVKMRNVTEASDYGGGFELARATRRVIRAIGPTDPDAALKLARELPASDGANNLRPAVMAMAASFQKGENAKTAWKECVALVNSSQNRGQSLPAEIACQCRALGGPPEITQTLWQKAIKDLNARSFGTDSDLIYHAGFFDPVIARMLAEQAFDLSVNATPMSRQAYTSAMAGFALASSDPEYALNLIDGSPDEPDYPKGKNDGPKISARLLLAQTLLLSSSRRLAVLRYDTGNEFWETD